MSNQLMPVADVLGLIAKQEDAFLLQANKHGEGALDFANECLFARQQIMKNEYTVKAAQKNPSSLRDAIRNIAAIGISLNPASAHAYLVPRDKAICLDISYRGLVKLATDTGAILWAKAELVYESDEFIWCGPNEKPLHKADPFNPDRAQWDKLKGVYCLAKLTDGTYLVDVMPVAEINKIRSVSKAQNGPWKTWPEEMAKKSVVKRAYKSWPQTPGKNRLDMAVQALHDAEGTAYTLEQESKWHELLRTGQHIEFMMFDASLPESARIALYNSFEPGQKVSGKKAVEQALQAGRDYLTEAHIDLIAAIESGDSVAVSECLCYSDQINEILISKLNPEQSARFDELQNEAA